MVKEFDFHGYKLDEFEMDFINAMKDYEEGQAPFSLSSEMYDFHVDPQGGKLTIWHEGEHIKTFENVDDMLLHFEILGDPLITILMDFDFC